MKNHKINYKKYITLIAALAMTATAGITTYSQIENNQTKYDVVNESKVPAEPKVEVKAVTEEQQPVDVIEEQPTETPVNILKKGSNPFENKEYIQNKFQIAPSSVIETGETTTEKGKEVYYVWHQPFGEFEAHLLMLDKNYFDSEEGQLQHHLGFDAMPEGAGLEKGDKVNLNLPKAIVDSFELPVEIVKEYFLPAFTDGEYKEDGVITHTTSPFSMTVNKDLTISLESKVEDATYISRLALETLGSVNLFYLENGKWKSDYPGTVDFEGWPSIVHYSGSSVNTKVTKGNFNYLKDLEYKAVLYLATDTVFETYGDELALGSTGTYEDIINGRGTSVDISDQMTVLDVDVPFEGATEESVNLTVAKAKILGYTLNDISIAGGKPVGISGIPSINFKLGYLPPKPETPETGEETTPELKAEPIKLPLENREFKGLEELIFEAFDAKDGNLNSKVTIKSGSVDMTKIGKYTLILEVTNSYGNSTEEEVVVEVFEDKVETPLTPLEPSKPIEKPEPKPEVKPETPVTPETKPEVKPEPKPEVKPEVKPETKPEKKEEATIKKEKVKETKPENKPETKVTKKEVKEEPKEKKNGPDKLLQTDISSLNTAAKAMIGMFTASNGLYLFKIRKK